MDKPDIYSDGKRPERCANCGHVRTTVFRSVYGTERIEYECMRRPDVNSIYLYIKPPDSWEKLEKDLDRCIKADSLCAYRQSEECSTCILPRDSQCHCDSLALEAIKERIRKLRGEVK